MNIFKILGTDEWYGQSELIEIAKGKYELPTTYRKLVNKLKRQKQWRKRNQ